MNVLLNLKPENAQRVENRNRVKWCTMVFSSVSGMLDFSPKSLTLPTVDLQIVHL